MAKLMNAPRFMMNPLGFGVREVEGEALSPELRWLLRLLVLEPLDVPHESKRVMFDYLGETPVCGPPMDVAIEDGVVPGEFPVPIRIYKPHGANDRIPACFWIHGGGWVIGSIASHDAFCRRLCAEAQIAVIAADYRLGPEHPFPAPQDDVVQVWRWVRSNAVGLGLNPDRLGVGGDSAGGTMTAYICQNLPPEEHPAAQFLCYMGADYTTMTPSREQWGKGYLLDLELLEWFLERYCPGEDRSDPRISVLLAESVVGHPPALVVTAGMDPHLDEGRAYADKLEEAGVKVERLHIGPMIHGFISFTGVLPKADSVTGEMIKKVGAYLRR